MKIYFNLKSVEVQPWTPLEVILNDDVDSYVVVQINEIHWFRLNQSKSAVNEHVTRSNNTHQIDWDNFKVLEKEPKDFPIEKSLRPSTSERT